MSLPKLLTSRLQTLLGKNYASVITALSEERKGSFRINALYPHPQEVFEEFEQKGIVIEPFAGLDGVYMFDRIHQYAIKGTRAFYDGKIYLQSITSMLPVLALAPQSKENILDICAAPGSKTTQIAMLMKNTGKIVALEQDRIRFEKMLHNIHLQ
jgi:tRNA (cytosine49-C5)-methyltransferase